MSWGEEVMGVCKFVSSAKLVEYLEQELLEALNRRGLYDISQYGWLDDDLADPDYSGLARWQAGELVGWPGLNHQALKSHGYSFISHMQTSLHSLGLALVFAEGSLEGDSLFCEEAVGSHCRDVALKLGLAAISLRNLFVALTDREEDSAGSAMMDSRTFRAPFARACAEEAGNTDAEMNAHLGRIDSIASEIAGKCSLCEQLSHGLAAMPLAMKCSDREEAKAPFSTREEMIQDLCDWYDLMIEAGNSIFVLFDYMHGPRPVGRVSAAR